ncbi:hypothetical protein IEO21_03853 [Rhodonia placenta]|uniref:Uncharacterized protein n=1 Tax=Rhodonia placenta TaxID=104341 RepID=A0A8H7P4X0_9APHY|nr:hypothetical protein IEO21_03853 [Postia placenta]
MSRLLTNCFDKTLYIDGPEDLEGPMKSSEGPSTAYEVVQISGSFSATWRENIWDPELKDYESWCNYRQGTKAWLTPQNLKAVINPLAVQVIHFKYVDFCGGDSVGSELRMLFITHNTRAMHIAMDRCRFTEFEDILHLYRALGGQPGSLLLKDIWWKRSPRFQPLDATAEHSEYQPETDPRSDRARADILAIRMSVLIEDRPSDSKHYDIAITSNHQVYIWFPYHLRPRSWAKERVLIQTPKGGICELRPMDQDTSILTLVNADISETFEKCQCIMPATNTHQYYCPR